MSKRDEEEPALGPLNDVGGAVEVEFGAVPGRDGDFLPKPKTFEIELEADCGVGGGTCKFEGGMCAV